MLNVGAVVASFQANIDGFQRGVREAQESVNSFKDKVTRTGSGISSAFSNIGSAITSTISNAVSQAKYLIIGLTATIGLLGKQALESAGEFEQSRIAFETMLGSAEEAGKMMKNISDFAMKTPFELPQLVEGSKKLLAYGITAEKLIPTLGVLGDISAGVGRDKLGDLIRAFGQVRAKGKLMAQELNQFAEAGVPLREMLSKDLKMSLEDFSTELDKGNLKIKFEEVEQSLANLTSGNGKFANLMLKQSKTFDGVVSNIKDSLGRLGRGIMGLDEYGNIKENSLFAKIKNLAVSLFDWLDANQASIISTADAIFSAISTFVTDALIPFGKWISENKTMVIGFLTALGLAFGTLMIISAVSLAVTAFTNPLFLVVGALTLLYYAWQTNFLGIQDITTSVLNWITSLWTKYKDDVFFIVEGIKTIVMFIFAQIQAFWNTWGSAIIAYVKFWGTVLWQTFSFAFNLIFNLIKLFVAIFTGNWTQAWNAAKAICQSGFEAIKSIFSSLSSVVTESMKAVYNSFTEQFTKLWNKAKEIGDKIRKSISDAFNVTKRNSPSILDRMNEIVKTAGNVLPRVEIPNYSSMIASSLAQVTPNVNLDGAGSRNVTINNYNTMSDKIDLRSFDESMAYLVRNTL